MIWLPHISFKLRNWFWDSYFRQNSTEIVDANWYLDFYLVSSLAGPRPTLGYWQENSFSCCSCIQGYSPQGFSLLGRMGWGGLGGRLPPPLDPPPRPTLPNIYSPLPPKVKSLPWSPQLWNLTHPFLMRSPLEIFFCFRPTHSFYAILPQPPSYPYFFFFLPTHGFGCLSICCHHYTALKNVISNWV